MSSIRPDHPLMVLRSSAGSGKTFHLVLYYLQLALADPLKPHWYRHILAITFTNMATAEMKERILKSLHTLSLNANDTMAKLLMEHLNISKNELEARAGAVFRHMLHHYDSLSISTIDSFMHGLIRSFARDLQLQPEFQVELNQQLRVEEAIASLFDGIESDKELTDFAKDWMLSLLDDEKDWDMRKSLLEVSEILHKEDGAAFFETYGDLTHTQFKNILDQLADRSRELRKELDALLHSWSAQMKDLNPDRDLFWYKGAGYISWLENLMTGKLEKPKKRVADVLERNHILADKKGSSSPDPLTQFSALTIETLQKISAWCESGYLRTLWLCDHVLRSMREARMIIPIGKSLEEIKARENFIFVSDFHKIISEIVRSSPAPFVYERAGERYHHLLFDEFQDTSGIQWSNFIPLISNSIGQGYSCLIVGDAKQAIYRWRNGKVEQFISLPQLPAHSDPLDQEAFRAAYSSQILGNNFRSAKNIVAFNNELFQRMSGMSGNALIEEVYQDLQQQATREAEGLVNVMIIDEKTRSEFETRLIDSIQKTIEFSVKSGYQLTDIAILTRRNAKEAQFLFEALQKLGIRCVSQQSLLLRASPQVRAVGSLLAFSCNPLQIQHAFEFLLAASAAANLLWTLTDEAQVDPNLAISKVLPCWNKMRSCIDAESWLNLLFENYPWELDSQTEQLFGHFLCQIDKGLRSIQQLTAWWLDELDGLYLTDQEAADAVKIMTIHQSKGLQFPIVIYPIWKSYAHRKKLWADLSSFGLPRVDHALINKPPELFDGMLPEFVVEDEMEQLDQINTAYVACTRAEDALFVMCHAQESDLLNKALRAHCPNAADSPWIFGSLPRLVPKEAKIETHNRTLSFLKDPMPELSFSAGIFSSLEIERGSNFHLRISRMRSANECLEFITSSGYSLNAEISSFFKVWFDSGEILNERDIVLPEGFLIRTDAMKIHNGMLEILEYKTGEIRAEHKDQVRNYSRALSELGWKINKASLYYPKWMIIEEVVF